MDSDSFGGTGSTQDYSGRRAANDLLILALASRNQNLHVSGVFGPSSFCTSSQAAFFGGRLDACIPALMKECLETRSSFENLSTASSALKASIAASHGCLCGGSVQSKCSGRSSFFARLRQKRVAVAASLWWDFLGVCFSASEFSFFAGP